MNLKGKEIFICLVIAILVALFSFLASESPDGLERVAGDKGFSDKESPSFILVSLIPDYALKGIKNQKLSKSLAGITGVLLVFFVAYVAAALLHIYKASK